MSPGRRSHGPRLRTILSAAFLAAALPGLAQTPAPAFDVVASIPGPVDRMRAEGHFAYLAADRTLTIYDLSMPASPKPVGHYVFPEEIWGFRVEGTLAYVAAGHSGLGVLDVSNPSAPALVAMAKMPGQAKNVAIAGTRAIVANHMSGMDIVDISKPAAPKLLNSAFLDGYARDVATAGTVGVAIDNPSGLYVFDLTGSDAAEPVGVLQSTAAPTQIEIAETGAPANLTVALLAGAEPYDPLRGPRPPGPRPGSLQIFDLSNPKAPALTASVPTSGGGRRMAVSGALVYVADGPDGLRVLDLAAPAAPRTVASYKTPGNARDVAVAGSLVLVAVDAARAGARAPEAEEVIVLQPKR